MSAKRPQDKVAERDGAQPAQDAICEARLDAGGVAVSRCRLRAHAGAPIRIAELTLAIIESAPLELEIGDPAQSAPRRSFLLPYCSHILPAASALHLRWSAKPTLLLITFERRFIAKLKSEIRAPAGELTPQLAFRDPEIDALAMKARLELHSGGASGPLYLDAVGVLLAVRSIETASIGKAGRANRGGLTLNRLRRVAYHIEANLSENLTLHELAEVTGLSAHHFASAFKISADVSPHRFILERRIARAMERLADPKTPITEIAHELGFASHGHFTTSFRRHTGVTPSEFAERRRHAHFVRSERC